MKNCAAWLVLTLLVVAGAPGARGAEVDLRVIVPEAAVRSGPGPQYREVYRAQRSEVFRVVERARVGYWFQVELPDGTLGWLEGDQAEPLEIDLSGKGGRSRWQRFKEAVFAPSPIPRAHLGLSFSAGALGGSGLFVFRPSAILDRNVALEAHIGEAVGSDGSLLIYGLDTDILIWPMGPLVPFFALGLGGATSFPKINGVAQASETQLALDAGGGALLILRKRITLRFDFRNYTLFTANTTANRQEYSGGLAVFF